MASSTKAARFLVLALFVVSAVILPSSVCHGIRSAGVGSGSLDPNHPVCIRGPCGPGEPYGTRPGGGYSSYPTTPPRKENLHP
ncbi:hypothetical protein HU200_042559 [Digitaria exilis]|uniref:Uncharacterized protein n=1 Tax=Digitaria exilis TaxID=1010633 RepID=A0A835B1T8_9POAL|nr:hypothetical protein HU200_042559 [Digitaria exilis]CAB3470746.1 unnamed protein product [Digitaria exilis]